MITNHYKKWLAGYLTAETVAIKTVDGTEYEQKPYLFQSLASELGTFWTNTSVTNARGVAFARGCTAPTEDDYTIDGVINTTYTATVQLVPGTDDQGSYITALYTITNTDTASMTIESVCLFIAAFYAQSYAYRMLADHTVLDEPVTIPAGGVGQVTYKIRVNYPI